MLEIFILLRLGRSIAARAREQGQHSGRAVLLLVGLWFGGELLGGLLGFGASEALFGPQESNLLFIYATAFAGAIFGALWAFSIVNNPSK